MGAGGGAFISSVFPRKIYIKKFKKKHCIIIIYYNYIAFGWKNEFKACKLSGLNRPFARSSHMVQNKLRWDANNTAGLPKQRNSYQSSVTFESPTV